MTVESYIAPGSDHPMRRHDANGQICHWILEVHLVDRDRQIGGFFEELLDLGHAAVTQASEPDRRWPGWLACRLAERRGQRGHRRVRRHPGGQRVRVGPVQFAEGDAVEGDLRVVLAA